LETERFASLCRTSDDSDNEDAPHTPSSGKVAFAAPTSPGGALPARRGRENSATTASGAAQGVAANGRRSQAMTSFAANEKKRKFKLVRIYPPALFEGCDVANTSITFS
jgi:hypothetical protein